MRAKDSAISLGFIIPRCISVAIVLNSCSQSLVPNQRGPQSTCSISEANGILQIQELCFTLFQTDDLSHPGIQSCNSALSQIPNTCDSRLDIKVMRCAYMQGRRLLPKGMTFESCLRANEGEQVSCEDPLDEECLRRMLRN